MAIMLDIETNGLDSINSRITCISCIKTKSDNAISFTGEDEKKILNDFWNFYDGQERIVTFNGDHFDFPFIIKRSIVNGVKIKPIDNRLDLRKVVNSFEIAYNKYDKGTLEQWSEILGLGKKESNGKEMLEFFANRDWDSIIRHCEEDVVLTLALYNRCVEIGLIIGEELTKPKTQAELTHDAFCVGEEEC